VKTVYVQATSWVELGATAYQAETIMREEWTVVNATRPLECVWDEPEVGRFIGAAWQSPFHRGWHFAAGNPVGTTPLGSPLQDRWSANDAHVVELVTSAEVRSMVIEVMRADLDEAQIDEMIGAFGADWVALAQNYGLDVCRPRGGR